MPVAFARSPFAAEVHRAVMPASLTLLEIVERIPDLPDRFWTHGIVCVNGRPVPQCLWGMPPLAADDEPSPPVVTLHVALGDPRRGGGGGGGGRSKGLFSLVASIALIAATSAISGGALAGVTGGFLAAGSTAARIAGGAVGLLGALAISALSPPPQVKRDDPSSDSGQPEQGTASASGNQLAPFAVIPRVIGTDRAFPSFATYPLVELNGFNETVEAVFCMNGPHKWENIRVGNVPIDTLDNVSYQTREGFDADSALTLITRQGYTDANPIEFDKHDYDFESAALADQSTPANSIPQWRTKISKRVPADGEIWMHILFPLGITAPYENPSIVPMRFRMRERGTSTWINLPEVQLSWTSTTSFKRAIVFKWDTVPWGADLPIPPDAFGFASAHISVPTQTGDPVGTGGWTAHSYFDNTTGTNNHYAGSDYTTGTDTRVRRMGLYDDRVEFYLGHDTSVFPPGKVWEVQFKTGWLVANVNWTPIGYLSDPFGFGNGVWDFFGYYTLGGVHLGGASPNIVRRDMSVVRFITVRNEHPIGDTGLALLAIKATNQAISDVSADLSGYVPDWNGSAWTGNVKTSNPAPHLRYLLAGPLNADPLPEALLDDDALVAWRTRCASEGYACNLTTDGRALSQLLDAVAGCGYARPRQSELWGVMEDYNRAAEAPVQVFSPRTMANFRWRKAFPRRPQALRLPYRDSSLDYEEQEIIVYDDGYTAASAERLEEARYDGLLSEAAVRDRARFDLRQARLRAITYHGRCDAEALVATRGDLVGVQHDSIHRQAGFARVKSVATSAGNITGLTLDSVIPVNLEEGYRTGIAIRLDDGAGTLVVKEIVAVDGEVSTISFVTPFADPGDLVAGCHVIAGELTRQFRRLIVADVQPGDDLTADITFVDEARAIHIRNPVSSISGGLLFGASVRPAPEESGALLGFGAIGDDVIGA